jgi:outer membrane lipoprotein-sorting protein
MRLVSAVLAAGILFAASPPDSQDRSASQLTDRMAQMEGSRTASLQGYSVTRHYMLHNKRFNNHAEMSVRMTYTAPDKKEFEVLSESGSGWIRSHVFRKLIQAEIDSSSPGGRRESRITPDNYNFRLLGTETANGRPCQVLDATPKTKNKYLFRGRVWMDSEDAAVARIEGSPAQNPSFWTTKVHFVHQYAKVGPYWLAASNISETEVRVFGSTELKIEYLDYVINPPLGAAASGSK